MSVCPHCQEHQAHLHATTYIGAGVAALVPADGVNPVIGVGLGGRIEITFDGSTRTADGVTYGGAAAILWARQTQAGARKRIRVAQVSLPFPTTASIAEAWGARLATLLAIQHNLHRPGDITLLCGDAPVIVRYCGGYGHSRSAEVHAVLEEPLGILAGSGRSASWVLIPRDRNTPAHESAGVASSKAQDLASSGISTAVHYNEEF